MGGTEGASARFANIEEWSTAELVDGIIETQLAAVAAVRAAAPAITEAIAAASGRLRRGGRLIYAGAGTSGRIAAQDAAELPPTFSWPPERAVPIIAGGPGALLQAVEGAEDDGDAARNALAALDLAPDDVVIGVAASGRTPYVAAALESARAAGALAIGVFNNPSAPLAGLAEIVIIVDTGEELVAGSTRMKAGTAQKVVLNCISTGVMVDLGFVYRGRMVEMRATNAKTGRAGRADGGGTRRLPAGACQTGAGRSRRQHQARDGNARAQRDAPGSRAPARSGERQPARRPELTAGPATSCGEG